MSIRPGTFQRCSFRRWILLWLVVAASVPAWTQTHTRVEKVHGRSAAAGEVLVKFRSPLQPARLAGIVADNSLVTARRIGGGGALYHFRSAKKDVSQLMRRFSTEPDVL